MGATAAVVGAGASIVGGISARNSANAAGAAAQTAANFNASIIERDIGLLARQRGIINQNFEIDQERAGEAFEREVQGAAKAGFGYAGVDMSSGTPMAVLQANAREFDYAMSVAEFNNEMTNLQISDQQEDARLQAQLARMGGAASRSAYRSQGKASLISGFGNAALGISGSGYFD